MYIYLYYNRTNLPCNIVAGVFRIPIIIDYMFSFAGHIVISVDKMTTYKTLRVFSSYFKTYRKTKPYTLYL